MKISKERLKTFLSCPPFGMSINSNLRNKEEGFFGGVASFPPFSFSLRHSQKIPGRKGSHASSVLKNRTPETPSKNLHAKEV